MRQTSDLPIIPIGAYKLEFRSESAVSSRALSASAWRGAFGHALKRSACVTRERDCTQCMLYRSCAYPYIFHTPPPLHAQKMRRYEAAPHPFVLRVSESAGDSRHCTVFLTLFGHGNRHLSLLLYSFMQAAGTGQGIGGLRLDLAQVWQEAIPGNGEWGSIMESGGRLEPVPPSIVAIPDAPGSIAIELHTPLRVKRDGSHVGPGQFEFADLFSNLLRRISMLSYFHTDTPLETDFRSLVDKAKLVTCRRTLRWKDMERYSSRQKTKMQMGGLVGRIEIEDYDLTPFWPYLWLGQWTHAGSAATMALGHYTLASLPLRQADEAQARLAS